MDPSGGRDSRYNLNYSMSMMSEASEIYGNPNVTLARPPSGLGQVIMGRGGGGGGGGNGGGLMNTQNSQCGNNNITVRGIKRTNSDCYDHDRSGMGVTQNLSVLENCGSSGGNNSAGVTDVVNVDDSYTTLTQQNKKSPPSNGKKTKGRVKIKMEYIDNKLRRYTTFSKRKTGIMKKAYELSTLTGTQVMLLVASETGHVYTFATRKLQPMITSEAGKALIQTCLNSPDPPTGVNSGDQRMSATGFEETELSYNIADDDSKATSCMELENEIGEIIDYQSGIELDAVLVPDNPSIEDSMNIATSRASQTLFKYRHDNDFLFMQNIFRINRNVIAKIFKNMTKKIYFALQQIDFWQISKSNSSYRAIIDCTEVPVQKSDDPNYHQLTFSSYKNKTTFKTLVAVDENGLVIFVSDTFGGAISDREIFEKSGMLNKLGRGDFLLADRGFEISDLQENKGVILNIPPLLRGKKQLTEGEIAHTRFLANRRIIVERVIGLAKINQILIKPMPK